MSDWAGQDPEQWDLEAAVQEAQRGSRRAFDVLCERYSDMVFRTVYRMLGDYELARDVTQEVFVNVFRNLHTCRQPAKFKAWLLTIATNESRNALRGKQKAWERSLLSYEGATATGLERSAANPLPLNQAIFHEQQHLIWQALQRLSPKLRVVIVLHYYHALTCEEMAEVLDRPAGTIKRWLYEARVQLRTDLGGKL